MIHLNFGLFPGSVNGAAAACQGEGVRGDKSCGSVGRVVWCGHRSRYHRELETNLYEV